MGGHILLLQQSQEQPVQKVLSGKCTVDFQIHKVHFGVLLPLKVNKLGAFSLSSALENLLLWYLLFLPVIAKKKKKKK